MKEIIEKAQKWALQEIDGGLYPISPHFKLANEKGQEIAVKLNADKDLVLLGTILMDIKLGECFKEGRPNEHVERSVKAVEEFLEKFDLDKDTKEKIINCVAAHHAETEFICKEAEICANADCYRFCDVRGFLSFLNVDDTFDNFEDMMKFMKSKVKEKKEILSLDFCKNELKEDLEIIDKLIEKFEK